MNVARFVSITALLAAGLAAVLYLGSDGPGEIASSPLDAGEVAPRDMPAVEAGPQASGNPARSADPGVAATTTSKRGAFTLPKEAEIVGDGAALYAHLRSLADAGDPRAAYELQRLIRACLYASKRPPPDRDDSPRPSLDCSGMPELSLDEAVRYLTLAADGGVVEAQVNYLAVAGDPYLDMDYLLRHRRGLDEMLQRGSRYLHAAASRGSVAAMIQLADQYDRGIMFDRDPMLAYAWALAAHRSGLLPGGIGGRLAAELSPEQLAQAERIATEIYARCCG